MEKITYNCKFQHNGPNYKEFKMARKILSYIIIIAVLSTASLEAEVIKSMPMQNHMILTGAETYPHASGYPLNPGVITQSPGIIIGTTWYDYQTNGSTGNRIALTDSNTIYVSWMNAYAWPTPPRHVFHNYRDANGNWNFDMGLKVDERPDNSASAGYTTLDIYQGYRGAIDYHYSTATSYITRLAVDNADYPGWGYFQRYNVYVGAIWPYIAIDRNNRIHIVITEPADNAEDPHQVFYVRSADGGETWTTGEIVDTLMTISTVIDASPVSDKVIIAYTHPTDYETQWHNDIMYILSEDGISWDFRYGKVNITNYLQDNDSLWAYTDMDVIFDYNDNFHLIWNAQTIDSDGYIQWNTRLFHYNSATEEINLIHMWPLEDVWIVGCDCGAWNRPICKMNMGVQEGTNILFTTWTQFDTTDCSQGGYANGELYMSYTSDGISWEEPVNLTNSHTDDCFPEECDSDHWSSLADVAHENLHIMYINDKDAGGIPQTEGAPTESPVMYLEIPALYEEGGAIVGIVTTNENTPIEGAFVRVLLDGNQIETDSTGTNGRYGFFCLSEDSYTLEVTKTGYIPALVENVEVTNYWTKILDIDLVSTGVDEETALPERFNLGQNYPNPFNEKTTISFELKKPSQVLLEVFDITGAKIITLVDEYMPAGSHLVTWEACDFASGVYYYRLKASDYSDVKQAVLLK
ncbi:MAG: hypothetical protein DRP26_02370 [Candidatus Zixiibacteriota bacterium]|nr:MAG: hypothetical protein DRP26_02370 [candidate division Zixibacteria bacterium]